MNLIERFKKLTVANQANVIFGCIVTFATAGNLIIGIVQYDAAKKNAESSSEQTKQLICAANKNAKAAESFSESASAINTGISNAVDKLQAQANKMEAARITTERVSRKSIDATINNLQLDQRAWVGVKTLTPPGLVDKTNLHVYIKAGSPPHVEVIVLNNGKTPALNYRAECAAQTQVRGHNVNPIYSPIGPSTYQSIGVLQPGSMIFQPIGDAELPNSELSQSQIDSIKAGTDIFYVYGHITYDDVFKHPHITNFCYFLSRDLANGAICNTYNDAD